MKNYLVFLLLLIIDVDCYDKDKFASNGGFSDPLILNSEVEVELREYEDKKKQKEEKPKAKGILKNLKRGKGSVPDFND